MNKPIILLIEFYFNSCLAIVGVLANSMTIVILSRGNGDLSKGVSAYLISMATADLLVVIFCIILRSLLHRLFPAMFWFYTTVCNTVVLLGYTAIDCSVWLTIAFTVDRFVAICCHNLKVKYCTTKTAAIVITTVTALSVLRNIPFYFRSEPYGFYNGIPWGCAIKLEFFSLPGWVAFFWIHHLLNPLIPYFLILILNVTTVRHIVLASRARRGLKRPNSGVQRSDPELAQRRRSIILLFVVSGSFILLWLTKVSVFILMEVSNRHAYPSYNHPVIIADQAGAMLFYLGTCTNTAVYALTQKKFRDELKRIATYPFSLIAKLCTERANSLTIAILSRGSSDLSKGVSAYLISMTTAD
ncbi:probable G-protein coupled receptor 139 [Mobula birostris]|uniref:probable G-protein coupled receptor 139 n=1 Tax=Mobula birostris TaxID=1983395 RepID=UPI003B27DF9E